MTRPGATFGRLTVLPAIIVAAWLLTGPAAAAGRRVPAGPDAADLGAARDRARGQRAAAGAEPMAGRAARQGPRPRLDAVVRPDRHGRSSRSASSPGSCWRNSPSVIATRSPGAYFQTGYWIAQHGSLPIPGSLAAFGGRASRAAPVERRVLPARALGRARRLGRPADAAGRRVLDERDRRRRRDRPGARRPRGPRRSAGWSAGWPAASGRPPARSCSR